MKNNLSIRSINQIRHYIIHFHYSLCHHNTYHYFIIIKFCYMTLHVTFVCMIRYYDVHTDHAVISGRDNVCLDLLGSPQTWWEGVVWVELVTTSKAIELPLDSSRTLIKELCPLKGCWTDMP